MTYLPNDYEVSIILILNKIADIAVTFNIDLPPMLPTLQSVFDSLCDLEEQIFEEF